LTPELSEPIDAISVVFTSDPTAVSLLTSSVTPVDDEVEATQSGPISSSSPGATIEAPVFLRAWRGYDRHQVDTFARQSLALIHALRRRAQRAESRILALEAQLRAHRAHSLDDPERAAPEERQVEAEEGEEIVV
jgi:hypothetical protein